MQSQDYLIKTKHQHVQGLEHTANGVYTIPHPTIKHHWFLCHVIINGEWEHVSAQLWKIISIGQKKSRPADRCLTWTEQCFIRNHFWGPQEVVVQYFPAMTNYVGTEEEEFTVHLWNPLKGQCAVPQAMITYGLSVKSFVDELRKKFPKEDEQELYNVVYYLRDKLGTETFYREAEKIFKPKPTL